MTRKLATLLILAAFGVGIVAGLYVKQNALQNAVLLASAKSDAYGLAAFEMNDRLNKCERGRFFKR